MLPRFTIMTSNRMLKAIALFVVSLFTTSSLISQTVPNKPDLYYVTVDPETGNDIIVWQPSQVPPAFNYYTVAIAAIINPTEPYVAQPIANVFPPNTSYVNVNTASGQHSVGYTVWATRDLGGNNLIPSLFDDPDSTLFLQVEYDSCGTSFTLSWNDYNTWRGNIEEYNIYRRIGPNNYSLLGTIQEGINTYTRNLLQSGQQYDLFVEAVNSDNIRTSTSNIVSVNTGIMPVPAYINANYATIAPDNTVDLSFSMGSENRTYHYELQRSTSENGTFSTIYTFDTSDSTFTYNDPLSFQSGIYYYRLNAINNCNQESISSNLASTILLRGNQDNFHIALNWNQYVNWLGGVDHYMVRRYADNSMVTDSFNAGQSTTYTDDISSLVDYNNPLSNEICYEIKAIENPNIYQMQGKSISNRICFSVNAGVRFPNAMIPNDPEPENQVFEPVFAFIPDHYIISIYNRLGLKIWEGNGPWDGKVNGAYVPEGVYLFYIRIYGQSNEVTEFNGKITVLYR